jgi:hypothetical protein
MLRTAAIGLARSRVTRRVPPANQPSYTSSRIASCSRINAVTQITQAAFGTGRSGWSVSAARVLNALKVIPPRSIELIIAAGKQINLSDHHLIMIYYYKRSSICELDVAVPREKDIYGYACDDKHTRYEISCLAECHGTDRQRRRCTKRSRRSRIDFTVPRRTPGSTNSTVPSSPYHPWEPSIVPLHLIIYSNRVGLESDMPRTRLPVHKPQTACALFSFFTQRL